MRQSVFSIVADLDPGSVAAVREALAPVRADPGGNAVLPFAGFDTLHFASLVIADGPRVDPPKLIFESNVDGTVEGWLTTLTARARSGLDLLYAHSPGYPGSADPGVLREWLAARVVRPGAYHIGATGRSLARIRQEHDLHQAIGAFLDAEEAAGGLADATPEQTWRGSRPSSGRSRASAGPGPSRRLARRGPTGSATGPGPPRWWSPPWWPCPSCAGPGRLGSFCG